MAKLRARAAHGLRIPNLRYLVASAAYGDGTRSVFPSVTYPAHATIATGVLPQHHGIFHNRQFDPLEKKLEEWFWYAEELKSPPLWELASTRGLRTGLIGWPVTVGARVPWLVPEYWRARRPEDLKLLRALSTPGLLEAVQAEAADLYARLTPMRDSAAVDIASHVLRNGRPHLLLLHIWELDEAQHEHGPWSPEAIAALAAADLQLGRLLAAVEQAGLTSTSAIVVASDHGFAPVHRLVHPGAPLREAGFISLDEQGRPTAYRAAANVGGGLAYIYLHEAADASVEAGVRALFERQRQKPGGGIGRIYSRDEIAQRGGDAHAILALEPEPGVYFGPKLTSYETAAPKRGMHGYDPERAEMQASLLWRAPGVEPGVRHGTRLVDIAPTVAHWLGLSLPASDGKVLE